MTENVGIPPEIVAYMTQVEAEASAAVGDVATVHSDSTAAPAAAPKRKQCRPRKVRPEEPRAVFHQDDPQPPPIELPLSAFVTPLADFRERVAICREALVETYEDGPLKLRFDVEARRGLLRPMGEAVKW